MRNDLPDVLTPTEIAELIRTSEEAVISELSNGRLRGFKIGDEWRVTKDELRMFMTGDININEQKGTKIMVKNNTLVEWNKREKFTFKWPDGYEENYEFGYETEIEGGHQFVIGYTNRAAAEKKDRRRVVVFQDHGSYLVPVVEFTGANDFTETRRLASIIKDRKGRHVRFKSQLPPEYMEMPIVIYSEVVVGKYAAKSIAVIAKDDEKDTMLRHALIRALYKGWINN